MLPQIHIAGLVRAGKTTLARNLKTELEKLGYRVGVIEVDETRTGIFQNDEPPLGSQLQKWMQACTYRTIFNFRIPDVLALGGIPIFAATHAHPDTYGQAEVIAKKMGAKLRFILLEQTDFEEMVRRCRSDNYSKSDMRDPLTNPEERKNWEDISRRIQETYGPSFSKPHIWIPQGTPEEMTNTALKYILEE